MADAPLLELSSSKALQSTEQMQLLDIVDSLRAQGLSEFTALPQLIVCGDQSSGKSSVLEAISGVPFPRQDNLCTRFATEVILRRDATEGISVSIVPAKDRIEADTLRLRQFHHVLASRNDFPGLFDKAKDAMGLSDTAKSFSKDVLRVEIRGPGQPQLTLVDLPGLIHTATKSQTKGDVELVKQLVTEYMGKRRSIILAVVSAKNDVGNQVVLERAREVDLLGQRTMGIITKPDTLHKGSSNETAFINLARNWDVKLELGWHVVKNLDSSTVDFGHNKRDEEESSFFEESNFKTLPAHNIGIAALRSRLSKVPFNHIRTELPRLGNEIDKKIHLCDFELKRMGTARVTPEQQRAFLIELSQSFQTICRDAVQGNYDSAFFTDNNESERRLCAVLMNLHLEFGEQLRTDGARWIVKDKKDHFDKKSRSREEAVDEACKLLRRSRGRELFGLPNPRLVGDLFREYSSPWEDLARQHTKQVWENICKFTEELLQYLTDSVVADAILVNLLSPIMEQRLEAAYEELEKLIAVHKEEPMTLNHYFLDNVKRQKQKATKDKFEERLKKKFDQPEQKFSVKDIAAIMASVDPETSPDMDRVAAEDAFDNMQAFYKVEMKTFMDNVPKLAIRAPMVLKVPSMLCPTSVYAIDSDLVTKIAGESEEKTLLREDLVRKLATLKTGASICKQYAVRSHLSAGVSTQSSANSNGVLNGVCDGVEESTTSGNLAQAAALPRNSSKSPQSAQPSALFSSVSGPRVPSIFETTINTPKAAAPLAFGSTSQIPNSHPFSGFLGTPISTPGFGSASPLASQSDRTSSTNAWVSTLGSTLPTDARPANAPLWGRGESLFPDRDYEVANAVKGCIGTKLKTETQFRPAFSDIWSLTHAPGTANSPFVPYEEIFHEGIRDVLYTVSADPRYRNWSVEELRLVDYAIGKKYKIT